MRRYVKIDNVDNLRISVSYEPLDNVLIFEGEQKSPTLIWAVITRQSVPYVPEILDSLPQILYSVQLKMDEVLTNMLHISDVLAQHKLIGSIEESDEAFNQKKA